MTLVPFLAPTASLLLGVFIGLLAGARRRADLREQLRLANKLHAAYITSAHNEDLAEVGPVTPPRGTVELYDQDAPPADPDRAELLRLNAVRSWGADPSPPDGRRVD